MTAFAVTPPPFRLQPRRWPLRRLAVAALVLLGACGGSAGPPRSVLIVTLDTTRADRIGCYGYPGAETPVVDGLAERGVLFEDCFAPTPTTLPSHASILTGLYPYHHGARNNGTHHLGEEITTLAERLSARGFATGAVVSAKVLDRRYGLDQGFEHYDDSLAGSDAPGVFMVRDTPADVSVNRALAWLEGRDDAPFFLWLHLFDPHANYSPPEPFASRFAKNPYDGEIAYADREIGRLLAFLDERGRLDETLVVFTADHGESLLEHGEPTHGVFVYDATTHVPLILAHESLPAGARVAGITSSVDIVPTVFDLLGLPPVSGLDGLSLRAAMDGAALPERRAYCESLLPRYNNGWAELRSLRGADWRYVRAPRPELYDLPQDPAELRNVQGQHPDVAARLESELAGRLAPADIETIGQDFDTMDPETRAELEDLGYVVRRGDEPLDEDELPDPKDMAKIMTEEFHTRDLLEQERHEEALPILERLVELDPHNTFTLASYAMALGAVDRLDEAIETMERLVQLPGARAENYVNLARLRRHAGHDDWREALVAAQERFPRQSVPWSWEGLWSVQDERFHRARELFEKALEMDPDAVEAWGGLGQVAFHLGDLRAAEEHLRRAREIDPYAEGVLYHLALTLEKRGRIDEAIAVYEEALEVDPEDVVTLVNVGTLQGRYGDAGRGEAHLRRALDLDPELYNAALNLGILLVTQGRTAEGAELLQRATGKEPKRPEAWFPLLKARQDLGDPAGVLAAAEGLLRNDPRHFDALLAAAGAAAALGDEAAASAYLARARASNARELDRRLSGDAALRALAPE